MTAFDDLEVVTAPDRAAWRRWLAANHVSSPGAFLLLARRRAEGGAVSYDEAVEEALCVGWIDGRQVPVDARLVRQHFAPRRPGGTWARSNKERVERLEAAGLMTDAGRRVIEQAKADGSWMLLDDLEAEGVPDDLAAALAANPAAGAKFAAFSPSARRAFLWWIRTARRPETRASRIADTAWCAEQGIREPRKRP